MTKRKPPRAILPRNVGAPTTYRPEYCKMLIDHMAQGYSFGSFGAVVGTHRSVLYQWQNAAQEFADAHKRGIELCEKFYVDMGRAIATGQLRRLKSERPVIENGKPVLGPDGKVLMEREYEPTQGNATAWIFLTKNLIGFKNENHMVHAIDPNPQKSRADDLTPEERKKSVIEMTRALIEIERANEIIDVTPKEA